MEVGEDSGGGSFITVVQTVTIKKNLLVRQEGNRSVNRQISHSHC